MGDREKTGSPSLSTVRLTVPDMKCTGCGSMITRALNCTGGVKKAEVDPKAHTADVEYDSGVIDVEAIVGVIERVGYHAAPAK